MTNNYVRRLSVLWTTAAQRDGLTVAVGVHVVVVHTRTTPVNDETTPSRLPKRRWYSSKLTDVSMKVRLQTFNYSPSFTEALSIKTEAPSIKYSVLNPQRPSPARTASRTRSRETPEPVDTDALRRDAHDARLEMYIVLACVRAGRNRRSFLNYILEPV